KTLQQRVVKVASNTGAFGYPFFQTHIELRRQLPHSQLICRPQRRQKSSRTQRVKPVRLIPRRRYHELQRRTLLVPHLAIVGREHTESVGAWRQVAVVDTTLVDQFPPVLVLALQHYAEAHLLRYQQA